MSESPDIQPKLNTPVSGLVVVPIQAAQTHSLRHSVLRPHQPLDEMVYEGDGLDSTLPLGAFLGNGTQKRLIGVVTLSVAPMPEAPEAGDHRLRGMAVEPALQGRGVGGQLIREAFRAIGVRGGRRI